MAVDWGAWDYSGGNGMRVGVEVSVEAVSHSETGATFTVEYWTDNSGSYDDGQTLNLTGSIGGTIDFNNTSGSTAVKRGTRTYTYTYSGGSYGSSPGTRTFGCKLSGAYNGVTPSTSHTSTIPARPYGKPAAPTAADAHWVTDTSITIGWNRHETLGEPYNSQQVQRFNYTSAPSWTTIVSITSGTPSTYLDTGVVANTKYAHRVRATNGEGSSSWDQTNDVYTTPSAPSTCTRSDSGVNQLVSWTNAVGYTEYTTEVWHAADGVWDAAPLATVASTVTSYLHTSPAVGVSHTYKVRNKCTYGGRFSAYSPDSAAGAGTAGPPSAPSGLSPNGQVLDPAVAINFTWTHNPTDGSAQTKYAVRHRVQGAGSWTTTADTASTTSKYTLPANTYAKGQTVEWQVMTYGSDPAGSPWSDSATWTTTPTVTPKYPVYLNVTSGTLEADHTMAAAPPSGGGSGIDDSGWQTLALGAGTAPMPTTAGTGVVFSEYRRYGRMVDIRLVRTSATSYAPQATGGDWGDWNIAEVGALPAEVRPTRNVNVHARFGGVPINVMVNIDGSITVTGGTNRTYDAGLSLSLDCVYLLD